MKVCVIGAGSSGIAAVKALAQREIAFDCFEKSDRVGGNWVFRNSNGMSSAYRSLHINTSRDAMAYASYPMPREYPDYPDHFLIARYFDGLEVLEPGIVPVSRWRPEPMDDPPEVACAGGVGRKTT